MNKELKNLEEVELNAVNKLFQLIEQEEKQIEHNINRKYNNYNGNNDEDNYVETNAPTYLVIRDNKPVLLKPWSRTPTPSLLTRNSRPNSSLEEWYYHHHHINDIRDNSVKFRNTYNQAIKKRQGYEHKYVRNLTASYLNER